MFWIRYQSFSTSSGLGVFPSMCSTKLSTVFRISSNKFTYQWISLLKQEFSMRSDLIGNFLWIYSLLNMLFISWIIYFAISDAFLSLMSRSANKFVSIFSSYRSVSSVMLRSSELCRSSFWSMTNKWIMFSAGGATGWTS